MTEAFVPGALKFGVVGAGVQGLGHVQCAAVAPNCELIAVCDLDEQKARTAALQHGAKHVFTDYRELFACAEIEAVSLVLPDHLHREVAVAALSAGKHVLLEKPMATTVADAEAILAAQKASGKQLMINWSNRWMHAFAQTKDSLDKGELGRPMYAYARLNNTLYVPTKMLSWSASTKLPFWLICHRYDIARWYFQSEAKRVHAVCRSGKLQSLGIDTPDFYQATVEFENGCVGNFESCWIMPESMPYMVDSKFELICSDGYVNIDPALPNFQHATNQKQLDKGTLYGDVMGVPVGFVYQAFQHFVNCCLRNQTPLITGEDGLQITKALVAMVESAETGQIVEL
jgi:predicted dehydrogenase